MTAFVSTFACALIGWIIGAVWIHLLDPYNLRSRR